MLFEKTISHSMTYKGARIKRDTDNIEPIVFRCKITGTEIECR